MKLFGFNKKAKEPKFRITETDRNWVEDSFNWLIKGLGYPDTEREQVRISEKHFPKMFSTSERTLQNLIEDLSDLVGIDAAKIRFELRKDSRDVNGVPFEIYGKPFETEIEVKEDGYTIHIAHSHVKRPTRLVFCLIGEFTKIRLTENKLPFDSGEDSSLFLFIAGIYFGFGIPLSQNLTHMGIDNDGSWETKWNFTSEMPNEVMAFALATYAKLLGPDSPEWKNELPNELKLQFELAVNYLNESPSKTLSKSELDAIVLYNQAGTQAQNNHFDSAISTLQKVLFLTEDEMLKASVYNDIGYYQLRTGDYGKGISNFQKALHLDPDFGFAYDNQGYALIKTGRIEEGKQQVEEALQTGTNDSAYTYRNFAIYHAAKNNVEKAEANFQLAFEAETLPVDLLELDYANFLINQGDTEKAMHYLKKAVDKGEPEAIKRMAEVKNS